MAHEKLLKEVEVNGVTIKLLKRWPELGDERECSYVITRSDSTDATVNFIYDAAVNYFDIEVESVAATGAEAKCSEVLCKDSASINFARGFKFYVSGCGKIIVGTFTWYYFDMGTMTARRKNGDIVARFE